MKAPTAEQCTNNEKVESVEGRTAYATWYPQCGGYSGKCIVVLNESCFDVYLWHDGDFPIPDDQEPEEWHHCDADQFIEFGQTIKSLQNQIGLK